MKRFICIHGHFYQPPRENPWLESIEVQDSAYPYHDWNERITAECYGPNAASRVLDDSGLVYDLSCNYARISFNFGPTLLSWMETEAPQVYERVLQADRDSVLRFSGHGSALAQAYNHLIMPLANERDRRTQIAWGIKDFEHRFQRKPEGMWLPETAVDTNSLELLAEFGIKFTILAPRQAAAVRKIGDSEWTDVTGEHVDPTRPYLCKLPSGKEIALFFYDGAISRDVAFNRLLNDGNAFASRLMNAFPQDASRPALVHTATDGETYGHHHRYGDMALASAMNAIDASEDTQVTIYGEYLEMFPPEYEAQIVEDSSWSCVHGVERWRSNCGCNTGGHGNWTQAWRAPLRDALNVLREAVNPAYEEAASELVKTDPWEARDAYIDVVLDRSPESIDQFMSAHAKDGLSEPDRVKLLKLLELQRHEMLMYTSCGWFFDELSGIETVQVIQYAGRVAQLSRELFNDGIEEEFLQHLEKAKSNLREHGDGKAIYEKWVRPAEIDLAAVAAHTAISELFERNGTPLAAFELQDSDVNITGTGRANIATGLLDVKSLVTTEVGSFQFAAVHMGDHNVSCGIKPVGPGIEREDFASALQDPASTGDLPGLVRTMDSLFGTEQYSLQSLFRDEQRRILNLVLRSAMEGAEGVYQALYEQQAPVMRFLGELGSPVPQVFQTAAEYFLNSIIRRELEREDRPVDFAWIRERLDEAALLKVEIDTSGLGLLLEQVVHRLLQDFEEGPADVTEIERLEAAVDIAKNSPLAVDLWDAQNFVFEMSQRAYRHAVEQAEAGDEDRAQWAELFRSLATNVSVKLP